MSTQDWPTGLPAMIGDVPRRVRVDLATPQEQRLRDVLDMIEGGPADVRLTRAGSAIQTALDLVADYHESAGIPQRSDGARQRETP